MLQFITDYNAEIPVAEQVRKVLDGGCTWIQISMPGASDAEISGVVNEIMPLCLEKQAFLLLTDNTDLAKTLNVGGVALTYGSKILPSQARVFLGAAAVVGVGVKSFEDVVAVRSLDVDYLFMPLRSDEIGPIVKEMREKDIILPVVASGDVAYDDLDRLFAAGINGVAVSSAIARAKDITLETRRFITRLDQYERQEIAEE